MRGHRVLPHAQLPRHFARSQAARLVAHQQAKRVQSCRLRKRGQR